MGELTQPKTGGVKFRPKCMGFHSVSSHKLPADPKSTVYIISPAFLYPSARTQSPLNSTCAHLNQKGINQGSLISLLAFDSETLD
jgi:hypothetical protein